MKRVASLIFALGVAVLAFQGTLPKPAHAATTTWDLRLMGIQENPPVLDDAASGVVQLSFDEATRTISFTISIWGVAPELILAGHIHAGPAPVGVNTAPKYPLLAKGQTYASGKVTIDAADIPALLAGDLYVNIHTIAHPGGAARAQIESTIKTIYRMEINARSNGDLQAFIALFADNAQQIGGGSCSLPTPCVTKDTILRNLESNVAAHQRYTIVAVQVAGNVLSAREEVTSDVIRAAGVERVVNLPRETYQGDKILRRENNLDASDPQTARFLAFQAAQQTGQGAIRPPATGDGGLIFN